MKSLCLEIVGLSRHRDTHHAPLFQRRQSPVLTRASITFRYEQRAFRIGWRWRAALLRSHALDEADL